MSKYSKKKMAGGGGTAGGSNFKKIDYKALQAHVVECVQAIIGVTGPKLNAPILGIIAGIAEYGHRDYPETQDLLEQVVNGKPDTKGNEMRAKMVAKGDAVVFTSDNGAEMIRYTPKSAKEIGYWIDFPEIIVDKGQFFGESSPLPLRIWFGGDFDGKPSRPIKVAGFPVKSNAGEDVWMCGKGSFHMKLANATRMELTNAQEFPADQVDNLPQEDLFGLIGRQLNMNLAIFENMSGYYTERCGTPNPLGRNDHEVRILTAEAGDAIPEYKVGMYAVDAAVRPEIVYHDSHLFCIEFEPEFESAEEEKEYELAMRHLPYKARNYMKEAINYSGSGPERVINMMDAEFEERKASDRVAKEASDSNKAAPMSPPKAMQQQATQAAQPKQAQRPVHTAVAAPQRKVPDEPQIDFDDDIPF